MGLVDIFAKVMFKRGTEAAGKKIAEAIDKRKVTKAGINQESEIGWEPTAEEKPINSTSSGEMSFLDKCIKYRFILIILCILSFACQMWADSNARKYKATYQKVGEYHVKQYGTEMAEKNDYVSMYVVSAEPLMCLTSTTTSTWKNSKTTNTTLYDVYYVKDNTGHAALYCDYTNNTFTGLLSGSSYEFEKKVPCTVLGQITSIYDEFKSYKDYSTYVTKELEQLDMIMEGNPPDGVYEYVQSEENRQKEQTWITVKSVAKYAMYSFIGLFVILFIVGRIKAIR